MQRRTADEPPRAYRWIVAFFRLVFRLFFRSVQVSGLKHVPEAGGGLVVAWHPNGLIDPGLILTHLPRHVVFGARHGLFKMPVLGQLMRAIGTVPIYRRKDAKKGSDPEARKAANRGSLDAMARAVADGSYAALFPEGISHDRPDLQELKTGVASLYYRAVELLPEGEPLPAILPVGLHYDRKRFFGSNVLVAFHPPLELDPELSRLRSAAATPEERRERYRKLTGEIERALREAVYGTGSWELYHRMHRARKLVRAERAARAGALPEKPDMVERVLGFARFWTGYAERIRSHPQQVESLFDRIGKYDSQLKSLGLEDHELDVAPGPGSVRQALLLVLQAAFVYFFLPALLVIGYAVNLPTALLVLAIAKLTSRKGKEEASAKVIAGALAFPVTWVAVALAVSLGWGRLHAAYPAVPDAPILTGLLALLLSAAGGLVALHYWRLAGATARTIRVRFTRTRRAATIRRLKKERARIHDLVMQLSEGLELPGEVAEDGRIVAGDGITEVQDRNAG